MGNHDEDAIRIGTTRRAFERSDTTCRRWSKGHAVRVPTEHQESATDNLRDWLGNQRSIHRHGHLELGRQKCLGWPVLLGKVRGKRASAFICSAPGLAGSDLHAYTPKTTKYDDLFIQSFFPFDLQSYLSSETQISLALRLYCSLRVTLDPTVVLIM
jgi:hypothetical protein